MPLHRILRVTTRGHRPTVSFREIAHYEADAFTADELATLDAGGHVVRPDAIIVDLNAYYEAAEAERSTLALQAVG